MGKINSRENQWIEFLFLICSELISPSPILNSPKLQNFISVITYIVIFRLSKKIPDIRLTKNVGRGTPCSLARPQLILLDHIIPQLFPTIIPQCRRQPRQNSGAHPHWLTNPDFFSRLEPCSACLALFHAGTRARKNPLTLLKIERYSMSMRWALSASRSVRKFHCQRMPGWKSRASFIFDKGNGMGGTEFICAGNPLPWHRYQWMRRSMNLILILTRFMLFGSV